MDSTKDFTKDSKKDSIKDSEKGTKRRVIIGVDPGANIGVAVFGMDKTSIVIDTIKDKGKNEVVRKIIEYGNPSIIASDVSPPPDLVLQIASYFNAKVFSPFRDISKKEKCLLAKGFCTKNNHERDATAAVIEFFKRYKNKFRRINRIVNKLGLESNFDKNIKDKDIEDEIKHYVIMGFSIQKALILLKDVKDSEDETKIKGKKIDINDKRRKDKVGKDEAKKIGDYKDYKYRLHKELSDLLETNTKLKSRISVLSAEREKFLNRLNRLESKLYNEIEKDKIVKKMLRERDEKIKKVEYLFKRVKEDLKRLKNERSEEKIDRKEFNPEKPENNLEYLLKEYKRKRTLELQ